MTKVSLRFLLCDILHEAFFTGYQEGNISSIITHKFFVTWSKQPLTIGTNQMWVSRDNNSVNTTCFPQQLHEDSWGPFAVIAYFDAPDMSCPIGKWPFSLLLLWWISWDISSQYAIAFGHLRSTATSPQWPLFLSWWWVHTFTPISTPPLHNSNGHQSASQTSCQK